MVTTDIMSKIMKKIKNHLHPPMMKKNQLASNLSHRNLIMP